ncbi:MAG: tRNA 2-thiouridine(34) synthase MnmA [Dehalococcoidia bacterium]|nr:tRNA 2-thiouridine(34) synthase MnmA [Dehalococcoidia bacterium]
MKERIVVAMSGGVDSSVAAYLLKEAGYEVIGLTMRLYSDPEPDQPARAKRCCSIEDIDDARRVCQIIGAPHYAMNFEEQFKTGVIDYFISEYQNGRTPHPCIACNSRIKFDALMERAQALGADLVATGHYARISHDASGYHLLRAGDPAKDQSYVLFNLRQDLLSRIRMPIGEMAKPEVRRIAAELGLPVADKPDSQEICFVTSGSYKDFIKARVSTKAGNIVDGAGNVIGRHNGSVDYTVGQRKGLGLAEKPGVFVTAIDAEKNEVKVGPIASLMGTRLLAGGMNYVSGAIPNAPISVSAKIRYKSIDAPAILIPHAGSEAEVVFATPQRAITPGQAVVLYQGDEVIAGGFISKSIS